MIRFHLLPFLSTSSRLSWLAAAALLLTFAGCATESAPASESPEQEAEHAEGEEHEDEHAEETGLVELSEAMMENAGIVVAQVETREVAEADARILVPAHVELDPARVALISPRTSGRIERLAAVEGDAVGSGQPVAWLLTPDFLSAQEDYLQASARARALAGSAEQSVAEEIVAATARRLTLLGATDDLLEALRGGGEPLELLPVLAPFAGTIVEAHTLAGAAAEAGTPIYTVADLSTVNVIADVPERSLPALRRGQLARIELTAYPGEVLEGEVTRIREQLDPSTRTAQAVIRVANDRRMLRSGMFATVQLLGGEEVRRVPRPVVPSAALIDDGENRYVFVEVAPRTFERRYVDVEPAGEGELVVRSGLAAGERLVVSGAFTLRSELAKGGFGGHAH